MDKQANKRKYNITDQGIWDSIFSEVPEAWTRTAPSESMRDCLDHFKEHRVQTVLDLGCGIGIWALFLSKAGVKVTGFDFSQKAIDFAQDWAKKEGQEVVFSCAPLTDHPFQNQSFDGILAAKILDNISSEELNIVKQQINAQLNPNGILYALFNPYMAQDQLAILKKSDNPTKGITSINFKDRELEQLFPEYHLLQFKRYEHGFRGLVWQKNH
ncbi:methyltransferase domain-containing protein [Spongiimicrobium sp. 2-473A-2-J]|uniref:class I SAM-dependent methyltransferase n=1 Tax=Eudoraea algarum TaxID=3417568 RepID=UPI003D365DBC